MLNLNLSAPAECVARAIARKLCEMLRATPEADRKRPATLRLTDNTLPELFRCARPEDVERGWKGVEYLEHRNLIKVILDPKTPANELAPYRKPSLKVSPGSLAALAEIAGIKLSDFSDRLKLQLIEVLQTSPLRAAEICARLPAELREYEARDLITRFQMLRDLAQSSPNLFLREASARCFNSDSKILDGRSDFVALLIGQPSSFRELPISLQFAAPLGRLTAVVFVENLATFERLREERARFPGTLFVWSAGCRASAIRASGRGGRALYGDGAATPEITEDLELVLDGASSLPLSFIGDLDYSGMSILASLRAAYPTLTSWRPGFNGLLALLLQGKGHTAKEASKDNQRDPGLTGCNFADSTLLPAIRSCGYFVDQEAWDWNAPA